MLLYYITLIVLSGASGSVVYEDCGSAYDLKAVHIAGCGEWLPCYVTLGEDVPVTVEFFAGSAYDLKAVHIAGCGEWLPCYVTLGEDVPVTVEFFADFISRKLDQDVVININYINLRTRVTPEPCEIVHCPVSSNAQASFTSVMAVPNKIAVNQRGFLRWQVRNEKGMIVLCYSVPVQTQSPLQKFLRQQGYSGLHNSLLWQKLTNQTMAI